MNLSSGLVILIRFVITCMNIFLELTTNSLAKEKHYFVRDFTGCVIARYKNFYSVYHKKYLKLYEKVSGQPFGKGKMKIQQSGTNTSTSISRYDD